MRVLFFFTISLFILSSCKIQSIEAKPPYVVKSIKDFGAIGNGIADDHQAFVQAAQFFNTRSGNGKLIIPQGTYKVGSQQMKQGIFRGRNLFVLKNCSNVKIEASNNSEIVYKDGMRFGTFIPYSKKAYSSKSKIVRKREFLSTVGNAFFFINCTNILIQGVGINGNADKTVKGGRYGDRGIQAPYSGISIKDGKDIVIQNCTVKNFGLDGIYLSCSSNNSYRNNITISNTDCEYNGRQGLSIVGSIGVQITDCKFNYTGRGKFRSSPMAGIDIEPNNNQKVRDVTITNCQILENRGVGFISMGGDARKVKVENSMISGRYTWSCWVQKPEFTFTACKFYGSIVHGYPAKNDLDRTRYLNCYFADTTFKTKGAYLAELSSGYNQLFQNCTFKANYKKVIYHRNRAPNENLYTEFRNCKFWVNTSKFGPKAFLGIIGKAKLVNNTFETSESKSKLKGKYYRFENVIGKETNNYKFGLKTVE